MQTTDRIEPSPEHGRTSASIPVSEKIRIAAAVVPALFLPSIGSLLYFAILKTPLAVRIAFACDKVFLVAWPLIAVFAVLRCRRIDPIFRSDGLAKTVLTGVVVGLLIVTLRLVIFATPLYGIVAAAAGNIRSKLDLLGFLEHFWLFAVLISVVHSFIEEFYWRWFVFGQLRRVTNRYAAHAIAAVFFSGYHVVILVQILPNVWGWILGLSTAFGGLIWSIMYQRQGNLVGVWISHVIVDVVIMVSTYQIVTGKLL
jgi:membrane protease YdiL (CAAX protease family)